MISSCKLKEVAKIEISSVDKKINKNEIKVKSCNFMDIYYNWTISDYISSNFLAITANQNEIDKFKLQKGQVAITKDSETRDDIGMSAYISKNFKRVLLGYHCALITPDETKLNGEFLNVLFHTEFAQKYFKYNSSGSGQRYTLTNDSIGNFPLYLPSLKTQLQIGTFFSEIEKIIENNNKINANLEKLAKTIYDYWFLQFEFPDEKGNPYKSFGGKMIWNNYLGKEIPENWTCDNLGNLIDSQSGYAFKSSAWKNNGNPVLTIKTIEDSGNVNINLASYIDKRFNKNINKYRAFNGNMIFAMSGNTIGKVGIIASSRKNIFINQRVLIIKTTSSNIAYSYFILRDKKIRNIIEQLGRNSAQPNISEESLRNIKICIPDINILNKYNKICKKYFEEIIHNRIENESLISLRNFLLPLLMNGQITFKD